MPHKHKEAIQLQSNKIWNGILVVVERKIIRTNQYLAHLLEFSSSHEMIGREIFELIAPESEALYQQLENDLSDERDTLIVHLKFLSRSLQSIDLTCEATSISILEQRQVLLTVQPPIAKTIENNLHLEALIRQQNEDIRKINGELDNFVYRTSHDLRAPLVSVLGLIRISLEESNENERRLYLELMEKSILKLDTLLQDIINYSRNSRMEMFYEPIDINLFTKQIFEEMKLFQGFESTSKSVYIHQDCPLVTDPFRLKIIFKNIISNAIKFKSPLNPVSLLHIDIRITEERLILEFKDNGVGIDPKNIHRIFEMFYRASSNSTGSGLGLYIVKEVVNTLKGSISVESEIEKGTTFNIEIPNETDKKAKIHE